MINWFDVPSESPNKDLTLKNLKVSENGTYGESGVAYSSVEVDVNGGGGGGESDFTTAKVVLTVEESVTKDFFVNLVNVFGEEMFFGLASSDFDPKGIDAVLYKSIAHVNVSESFGVKIKEVSGAATMLDSLNAAITGDCTITFTIAST